MANLLKKILIVEDEQIMIDLLTKKLENEGYKVVIAKNGKEGLVKIREENPDLVLLDVVMPEMGGFELMKEINKDARLIKIPVIMISNSGQPVDLEEAQKLGIKDWLIKTEFDPREVVDKIKKYI